MNIIKQDELGLIHDSLCVDCSMDTHPGHTTRAVIERGICAYHEQAKQWRGPTTEVYDVRPHVSQKSVIDFWSACLCVGCLKSRFGRRLQTFDFIPDSRFNDPNLARARRRLDRLVGSRGPGFGEARAAAGANQARRGDAGSVLNKVGAAVTAADFAELLNPARYSFVNECSAPRRSARQRDIAAAIKGAKAAGVDVARIEVDKEGRIIIIAGKPTESSTANALDIWMAKNARATERS